MSNKPVLTLYYMNGCGHCLAMRSNWNTFVRTVAQMTQGAELDVNGPYLQMYSPTYNIAAIERSMQNKIASFPTLIYYGMGANVDNGAVMYRGSREAGDLFGWFNQMLKMSGYGMNTFAPKRQ